MSLADASELMGVSVERVRQLVVAGDLPGVRFGNAWAVPRGSVMARRQWSRRRGRPLGCVGAWRAIVGGGVDLGDVGRYRNRGSVRRLAMSHGDSEFLASQDAVVVSGVRAAIEHGELLQPVDAVDLYVRAGDQDELFARVAAVDDELGDNVIRVVANDAWPILDSATVSRGKIRVAPPGAVGLDLAVSGDPRHWVAAESLVGRRD